MKRLGLILTFCSLAGFAAAGTFGTTGQGQSTVGPAPTDDYPSLAAAAMDFSTRPTGSSGDWTLLINTPSLTEPNNIAFGNNTNGYKVTVKPAAGIDATVTFTTDTANASGAFSGNWIIGTTSTQNLLDSLTPTENFTIDGSNNGTNSRNLTLLNVATSTNVETELVRTLGACRNITIKNTIIRSSANAAAVHLAVEFTARKTAAGLDLVPSNCTVHNCEVTVLTGGNAQNVLSRFSPATGTIITAGKAIDNFTVTSNTLNGIQNLINLGQVANATVTDNVLSGTSFLKAPVGIQHNLSNHASGWTIEIARNRFINWENAGSTNNQGLGPQVELDPQTTPTETGTYNVYNNFFSGVKWTNNASSAQTAGTPYRMLTVKCSATSTSANVNIYHNSFNMANVPAIAAANRADVCHAIGLNTTNVAFEFQGSMLVKNNIFVIDHNASVAYFRTSTKAGPGAFTTDYNTFYLGNGAKMAAYDNVAANTTPNFATLVSWQDAGKDAHSYGVDPRTPLGAGLGKWVSANDLHFDGDPSTVYLGTPVGILTDIDNQPRSTTAPVKGADELAVTSNYVPSAARDWKLFE